jgi:hypothetical protein
MARTLEETRIGLELADMQQNPADEIERLVAGLMTR